MNIEELREKWHRDAEQAHDWHEAAWELMRELDEARNELASRPKSLADYWAGRAKKAESDLATNKSLKAERDIFLEDARRAYAERDEAKRLSDSLSREGVRLADQRNVARDDLGTAEASLKFALETNKRLKAELGQAQNEASALLNNGGDNGARVRILEARLKSVVAELELVRDTGNYVWAINQSLRIARGRP